MLHRVAPLDPADVDAAYRVSSARSLGWRSPKGYTAEMHPISQYSRIPPYSPVLPYLLLVLLLGLPTGAANSQSFVGAAFQPYIGHWTGTPPQTPTFNSYTDSDISSMLGVMHPHFDKITSYSAGYASYYLPTHPYDKVDSNWRVAGVMADLNVAIAAAGEHAMVLAQGISQQVDSGSILNAGGTAANALMAAEIEGARMVADDANAVFPGTVTRLVFTNEYVTDAITTSAVDLLISNFRTAHPSSTLSLGVRSQTYGQLNNPASPYLTELQALVMNCDFIMLNLYPSEAIVALSSPTVSGMQGAVNEIATQYTNIKTAALALNSGLDVLIGETGWPTEGISFNDPGATKSTPAYAYAYFEAFQAWATNHSVESYVFDGIDEPWKSDENQVGGNPWTGPNGAEGHFGIWKLAVGALPGGITPGDLDYKYVPEPSSTLLFASSILCLLGLARRRVSRAQSAPPSSPPTYGRVP